MTEQSDSVRSFDGAPTFNHPELIRHLYENGLRIDRNILRDILALPHETLLDDLSAMLDDAKTRYEFFVEIDDESDREFHESYLSFPLHAIFLLREIDCSRSFDLVLGFLKSKDSECETNRFFIKFWAGDHIFETIWQIFFRLGNGREQELVDFLFARHVASSTKSPAMIALQQMALHYPKQYLVIRSLFESVFQRFLDTKYDETLFDSHLVAMVLMDYMELCPITVSPLAQKLYENGLVETRYCGSYDSLLNHRAYGGISYTQEIRDIVGIYDNVIATWDGYASEDESVQQELNFDKVLKWADTKAHAAALQKHEVAPRVGRNDPCPCGSGKKYKKCCLK